MLIKNTNSVRTTKIRIKRKEHQRFFKKDIIKFLGIFDLKIGYMECVVDSIDRYSGRFPAISIDGDEGLFLEKGEEVDCYFETSLIESLIIYCENNVSLNKYDIKVLCP